MKTIIIGNIIEVAREFNSEPIAEVINVDVVTSRTFKRNSVTHIFIVVFLLGTQLERLNFGSTFLASFFSLVFGYVYFFFFFGACPIEVTFDKP